MVSDVTTSTTASNQTSAYSVNEEIAHSVLHGMGAVLSIAGLAVLVGFASRYGDARLVVSCSIYGASLVLLYMASTLYHSIPNPRAKVVLQRIDHAAIYLLIAGTYTPFALASLGGAWGWALFAVVWSLAMLGVAREVVNWRPSRRISVSLYMAMGWLAIVLVKPMLSSIATGGLVLFLVGGLCYTVGVVFYLRRSIPYHHAIWHVFVLAGSASHFFAVLCYVVPGA